MNIGALPELILSWFKNQGGELLQPGKDGQQLLGGQFKPGQQYVAQVLENLSNGRSLIQIADQKLDVALPQQAKAGDVLRMTYIQSGPRPTFVLNGTAEVAAAQPVTVSQAARQVNALVRYVPVDRAAPAASVQVSLSAATQGLAGSAGQSATQSAAQPAGAGRPLMANPALLLVPAGNAGGNVAQAVLQSAFSLSGETVEGMHSATSTSSALLTQQVAAETTAGNILPQRLLQTVKESGLFYESHLGKWVRGEIGLESIQREPQARLAQAPGRLLDLPDLDGMPEQAANMASRQLGMLDGNPFVWQGQAWPGQDIEWQVGENQDGGQAFEAEAQKWRSHLRLTLPRLGGVAADLDVGALGLRIRLNAQTPEALAEMQSAMPELAGRLKDADLNLTSLTAELASGEA